MDEVGSWDNLHERFEIKRINHQEAYSKDNACTNWAEEIFRVCAARKLASITTLPMRPLLRYAQDSSWRENNRLLSNGKQVNRLAVLSFEMWQVS
jgi:hypothetical protein